MEARLGVKQLVALGAPGQESKAAAAPAAAAPAADRYRYRIGSLHTRLGETSEMTNTGVVP